MTAVNETLMRRLEQGSRDLHEKVRAYPTPIARCDDQLPKYIALRDAAWALLHAPARDAEWIGRVEALLQEIEAS